MTFVLISKQDPGWWLKGNGCGSAAISGEVRRRCLKRTSPLCPYHPRTSSWRRRGSPPGTPRWRPLSHQPSTSYFNSHTRALNQSIVELKRNLPRLRNELERVGKPKRRTAGVQVVNPLAGCETACLQSAFYARQPSPPMVGRGASGFLRLTAPGGRPVLLRVSRASSRLFQRHAVRGDHDRKVRQLLRESHKISHLGLVGEGF